MFDRPRPGFGYLLLIAALMLGAALLAGGVAISAFRSSGIADRVLAVALLVVMWGPLAVIAHAAFTTRYEVAPGELRLRAGFMRPTVIARNDIVDVEEVGFVSRALGWGKGVGVVNRLTRGLAIVTRGQSRYFITPSDPEAFRAALGPVAPPRRTRRKRRRSR